MVTKNPITGDVIQTKGVSDEYRNNYDAIFRSNRNDKDKRGTETDDALRVSPDVQKDSGAASVSQ